MTSLVETGKDIQECILKVRVFIDKVNEENVNQI